ncbi:NUDIX domain-containing protein [Candidatus Saccharibacteria bacterium]|nr:MAG: NUDIX domain-containing protein [Candidatus Saccharibacteria bacterium]
MVDDAIEVLRLGAVTVDESGRIIHEKIEAAQPYSAAFMLIKRGDKYLFVRRAHTDWMNGYYGLPSGKVEPGEGFFAAAIREAKEEVGVTVLPKDTMFKLAFGSKMMMILTQNGAT